MAKVVLQHKSHMPSAVHGPHGSVSSSIFAIMDNLLSQARKASRDPRDCRKTMDALRRIGFSDDAFSALHHQHGSAVTFFNFSEGVQRYREDKNNHRVHQRLMYVLLSCPDGLPPKGKSFVSLAEEAFRLILPIA